MSRLPLILVIAVGGLIVTDVVTRLRARDAVADQAPVTIVDTVASVAPPSRRAHVEIITPADDGAVGTPTIDLRARLAVRQRIEREGGRVYLDSMLAATDSTVVRWSDNRPRVLTVRLEIDTTIARWDRSALDDARSAMQAWQGNGAGLSFREVAEGPADIVIKWVTHIDSTQTGTTAVEWSGTGEIRSAAVTLSLTQGRDSVVIPAYGRRRVAVHEIGHALGLPHSARDDDAMFRSSPQNTPSRRDQSTLLLLYSIPHGPLRTP